MINCITNSHCEWCKQMEETQDHMFWYCPWVKKVWLEIFKWWGLENKCHGFLISNIWSWQSVFGRSVLKVCWNISIAATLWSLWLTRNQIIFEKKSTNLEDLIYLIKFRVLKWSAAAGLCDDSLSPAWLLSPECTIRLKYRANLNCLLHGDFDLFCFADGAFFSNPDGSANAGVGGFIKNKDGEVLYIFSGPSEVNCPLRAEIEAITFLINLVAASQFRGSKIKLYTDCKPVIEALSKLKVGCFSNLTLEVDHLRDTLRWLSIDFGWISRNLNEGADDLARQGLNRAKLVGAWF